MLVVPSAATSTRVSPAQIREAYSPETLDVFPTYVLSPDVSFYVPTTSVVSPALTVDTEFLSPGSPASMANLLAGDSSLMDRDQDLPLLPLPLLPLPDNFGLLQDTTLGLDAISVAGLSPPDTGELVVPASADLSREGPCDVHVGTSDTGDVPLISDGLLGCPYRMTSYDSAEVADVDPAYGLQLHHPRFLVYVGALESARLLIRAPGHWVRTMEWEEESVTAALQLQHDAGLITSNLQVLGQFVTILNWMSSEAMRLAFGKEVFPSDAMQAVSPAPRVHRAAHYMTAMGLWQPGAPGPLPISSCNNCMRYREWECFPD